MPSHALRRGHRRVGMPASFARASYLTIGATSQTSCNTMPGDEQLPLDAWGDLRVGDRVYFPGKVPWKGYVPRARRYELVELWSTTAPISGDPDALAVVRDSRGETMTVNVRTLRRL